MADGSRDAAMLMQQNNALRMALLATSPRNRKAIQTQTAGTGATTRFKLFNVGITTKLQLMVTADITIGVAIAVPSGKAPWNLISKVKVTDYDNTDRVNLSGFQLFILNSVRWSQLYGFNNNASVAALVNPQVPTAIGAGQIRFFIDVPLAFDADNKIVQLQDLRGAVLMQTGVGEMYLSIDWTTSLYTNNDVDSVYAGAATTTVVGQSANYITATLWQEYILPQAIGGGGQMPLPPVDLSTVYELTTFKSSDQLAVGQQKLINYPNVRSVIGAYFNYVSAGALSNAVSSFQLIANGNNILREHTVLSQQFEQRLRIDGDIASGVYFNLHRDKPIETALFGNIQEGITPSAVGANPYVEIAFESFYVKDAALPGMVQG